VSGPSFQPYSRLLLRAVSALLTVCLLVQFFIAGMAAMTNPDWWAYHQLWVAIFQWLVLPLPFLAFLAGQSRFKPAAFASIPIIQIGLQYILAHRALEGRLSIGIGLHAVNGALLLIVAAFLAAGFSDNRSSS
jgi:mercuric ion transport protein